MSETQEKAATHPPPQPSPLKKPPFSTIPVPNVPQTFHPFPYLPPELQLRVWEFALTNCYELCAETEAVYYPDPSAPDDPVQKVVRLEMVMRWRLVGRRWSSLARACRMAYGVVEGMGRVEGWDWV